MLYKFFDKKPVLGASVNRQLAEELHKPVIKKCKKRKIYAKFWPTKKTSGSRLSKKCLNRIFYNFFSVRTSILIVYCALQINGTVSLWSALSGISIAAWVLYVTHNFTKANIKPKVQRCISSRKHQILNNFMTITSVWKKKFLFDQAF